VLVVLYDDTGGAAWSPYGGRIEMPTMQRLADDGLTYSKWHTTALCSPTRSTFLTGRNHHQNGFASISESSTGFPGYNLTSRARMRRWRPSCATRAGARSG
jgi:arylsulfatase